MGTLSAAGTPARAEPAPPVAGGAVDVLEALIGAAVGLTTVAIAQAAPADLRFQQWRALVVVGRHGGVRVGELAARVGMSMPSASRLIDRLEARGYVSTARDPRDGRGTIVALTDDGAEVRQAVMSRRRSLLAEALADEGVSLPDAGTGLASLVRALERYA
jgi:DNA-binding MarR family transcriptional regulator